MRAVLAVVTTSVLFAGLSSCGREAIELLAPEGDAGSMGNPDATTSALDAALPDAGAGTAEDSGVDGCVDDGDCTGNTVCLADTRQCVECMHHDHCDGITFGGGDPFGGGSFGGGSFGGGNPFGGGPTIGGGVCDLVDHVCLPFGFRCTGTTTGCFAPVPICDEDRGFCVQCLIDEQCPGPFFGRALFCNDGFCIECRTNAECADPSLPFCDPRTNTCEACLSDADCPVGSRCSPFDRRCQP